MMLVTCEKELGSWTIRINGYYVACFWREKIARRLAMAIADAIAKANK